MTTDQLRDRLEEVKDYRAQIKHRFYAKPNARLLRSFLFACREVAEAQRELNQRTDKGYEG